MTLTKNLSLLLIAGSFASSVMADPITVYGKANISAQSSDEGEGSFTELKSNASRAGIKGDMALDNGLEVLYLFEWQVDLADVSDSDNLKSRNQYIGLKGDFGKILLGRKDTVLKEVSKPVDLFNDYEADLKGLWKGENRMSDSVSYESPSFGGVRAGFTYIAEDEVDADDGISATVFYGDKKLKKSRIFAALAIDSEVNGYDTQRAIVQTKLGDWTLGAIAHKQEKVDSDSSDSGFTVSAQYAIAKWKLKAQFQELEDNESISVGADYKLGSDTKAYIWYTDRSIEESEDSSWFAVGIEHKFSM
ncbi:porin [Aestuariibacter sp. AA17]|uniref:Porin n=1 Tax=Fluctibacter corallii TaxID=2984329 RepID=A0ABT3A8D6_9ALTE|nr:porin [Aestuariibacter sp. AA17]MCV2884939.1 porin [Aestuariibacter sp. AA17]